MKMMLAMMMVVLAAAGSSGHLWLDAPVSMGGTSSIGGTNGPCAGLSGGTTTDLTAGQTYNLQMRANLHGPDPFTVSISDGTGTSFPHVVLTGFAYDLSDTPAGDSFTISFTVPNIDCQGCRLQLKGMGDNGDDTWYNCASININQPPCVDRCDTTHGSCSAEDVCECKKGWAGFNCNVVVTNGGSAASLMMALSVDKKEFNEAVFLANLELQSGIDMDSIEISKPAKGAKDQFGNPTTVIYVTFTSTDDVAAADAAVAMLTRADNNQNIGSYDVVEIENSKKGASSGGGGGNDAGVAAGVTIFMLALVGGGVAGGVYLKKNPEKLAALKLKMSGLKLPGKA